MKLEYSSLRDEDVFIMTNFDCQASQDLLGKKGLYKIIWCKENAVTITVDGYKMELLQDEIVFCTPLNVVEIPRGHLGLRTFVFNKQFFCIQTQDDQVSCNGLLFFGSSQPQKVKLCEKEKKQFATLQYLFEEDLSIKDHLQGEMLRSLLKRMLILSTRMLKTGLVQADLSNGQLNVVREFNLLVEKRFRDLHQVKEYAELMFKSPKTLSNLFAKYSNKSPLRVINERILLEAKRLLLYSDKSAEEISTELGYKDAGHFSKFFKKQMELSPNNFRKSRRSSSYSSAD